MNEIGKIMEKTRRGPSESFAQPAKASIKKSLYYYYYYRRRCVVVVIRFAPLVDDDCAVSSCLHGVRCPGTGNKRVDGTEIRSNSPPNRKREHTHAGRIATRGGRSESRSPFEIFGKNNSMNGSQ